MMSSFTQTIFHSCATAIGGHQCHRKSFQRLCVFMTVVVIICTVYLFKAKTTTLTISSSNNMNRASYLSTPKPRIPLVVEYHNTVEPTSLPCRPHQNLIMIKTHKSSSSTLQNILLRKVENDHLKLALPKTGVYLKDGLGFHRDVIYLDDGTKKYNILASHMHLTTQEFPAIAAVMEDDTKWLSVLRNPVKQFESLYTYYGWQRYFQVDLHTFLEHPQDHFPRFVGDRISSRNAMCYDNGLDARFLEVGDPMVEKFISLMDSRFDLVLLAEYFDESLILLKDLLCWSLEDVVHLKTNSRAKESVQTLTLKQEESIKAWNWADVLLYEHYNRTLQEKIDFFGRRRMSREVEKLRQLKEGLSSDCVKEKLTEGDRRVWYPGGIKVNSFVANPDAKDPRLCDQLCMPELPYLQKLRTRMFVEEHETVKDVTTAPSKQAGEGGYAGFVHKHVLLNNDTDSMNGLKKALHIGGDAAPLPNIQVMQHVKQTTKEPPKEPPRSTCSTLDRVVMIKTHKCSSSTLQNILLRRAEDHNVSMAIPREGVYFSQAYPFRREFIFMDDGKQKYDIMASHMKFKLGRYQDIKNVMNKDTRYITILRDPAKQFESMYTYYGYLGRFGADLHTFLLHPKMYFERNEHRNSFQAGRNPMCHDNGLDARFLEPGDPAVEKFVSALDKWHDLVLIAEYFDESLILLKDLMCWQLEDIVYLKQNARSSTSVVTMTEVENESVRKWNWADTLLYGHFNRTLWKKVAEYGHERMRRAVAELRAKNEELSKDCVSRTVDHNDPRMWYPQGIKVNSFQVRAGAKDPHLCSQMTRPELKFLQTLRLKVSSSRGGRG